MGFFPHVNIAQEVPQEGGGGEGRKEKKKETKKKRRKEKERNTVSFCVSDLAVLMEPPRSVESSNFNSSGS